MSGNFSISFLSGSRFGAVFFPQNASCVHMDRSGGHYYVDKYNAGQAATWDRTAGCPSAPFAAAVATAAATSSGVVGQANPLHSAGQGMYV